MNHDDGFTIAMNQYMFIGPLQVVIQFRASPKIVWGQAGHFTYRIAGNFGEVFNLAI